VTVLYLVHMHFTRKAEAPPYFSNNNTERLYVLHRQLLTMTTSPQSFAFPMRKCKKDTIC
jgi:hypothetical protein